MKKAVIALCVIGIFAFMTGCGVSNKKQVPNSEIIMQVENNFSKYDCDCSWTAQHSVNRSLHTDTVSVTVKNESYYGYDEDIWEIVYQYDKSKDTWSLCDRYLISSNTIFNESLIDSGYGDYVETLDIWNWSKNDTYFEFRICDVTADNRIEIYDCAVFENICHEDVEVSMNLQDDYIYDEKGDFREKYIKLVQAGEHWKIEDRDLWIYGYGNYPFEVIGGHGYNQAVVEIPVYISEDCCAKAGETEIFKVWMNIHEGIYDCILE